MRRILFPAAESLLVVTLTTICAYAFVEALASDQTNAGQLTIPLHGRFALLSAIGVSLLFYWCLRPLMESNACFWVFGSINLLLQVPSILAHNRVDWLFFFVDDPPFVTDLSYFVSAAIFVGSLLLLVVLHRTIRLRVDVSNLEQQGVDRWERRSLGLNYWLTTAGLGSLSLLLTLAILGAAKIIGAVEGIFTWLPWTILTVGLITTAAVPVLLLAWLRYRGPQYPVRTGYEE